MVIKARKEKKMKNGKKIRILFIGLLSFLASGFSFAIAEPNFPDRPIELVTPYPPGSFMDIAAGAFKDHVTKILGQPVISIYKPGAGGITGMVFVANSKPDGYTLLLNASSGFLVPMLSKKEAGYSINDFIPICGIGKISGFLCVKDDSPYKTLHDFIQAAKTKKMKYATYGTLSVGHITIEALSKQAGFQAIHIPYAGAPASMTAVLGGHADMAYGSAVGSIVGPGLLRVLAVNSDERSPNQPDVPTFKELGYNLSLPGQNLLIFSPKGTPKERINKIYYAYKKAAEESGKEIEKPMLATDCKLILMGPEEAGKLFQSDYVNLKKRIEEMGFPTY